MCTVLPVWHPDILVREGHTWPSRYNGFVFFDKLQIQYRQQKCNEIQGDGFPPIFAHNLLDIRNNKQIKN